jgi:hypothetical protein
MKALEKYYTDATGKTLSKNPFAVELKKLNSSKDIVVLFQKRMTKFKGDSEKIQGLTSSLSSVVTGLHSLSGIVNKTASLVSVTHHPSDLLTWPLQVPFPPAQAVLTGIDVLLTVAHVRPLNMLFDQVSCDIRLCQTASDFLSSYNALIELFERLMRFLKRLEIYMEIQLTTMMKDTIVEIMFEILSVVALAAKQIKNEKGGPAKKGLTTAISECAIAYTLLWLNVP